LTATISGPAARQNRQRAKAELQQQRAQHDVAIKRQQRRILPRQAVFSSAREMPRIASTRQTIHRPIIRCRIRQCRRQRRALHVHMQAHHQPEIEHNVEEVADHQQNHRRTGVLHAQQPAQQNQFASEPGALSQRISRKRAPAPAPLRCRRQYAAPGRSGYATER
jgi:hypothetical protein